MTTIDLPVTEKRPAINVPGLNPGRFSDSALCPIAEKMLGGTPLSFADGMALWHSRDIFSLGEMANFARRQRHGTTTYYNINRHINYSNICALSCKFCEFHRKRGEQGAYEFSHEDVFRMAGEAAASGATEVHIVGGLHPWLPFDWYLQMLRGLRTRFPKLHLKAFTAIEINHFTKISKLSTREVLIALHEAGLGSMPGGGAEVFDDRVHDEVFKGKLRADGWMEVHRTAHELGIKTNATLLYGHVETRAERIKHLIALRELQNTAPGFQTIIPLSFIPEGSELGHLPGNTGLEDLKMLAISRLMLDNFDHVKAFWIMQSMKLSQVSLDWGVDDLDGTVVWYDITKREGGAGNRHQEQTVDSIRRLIVEAGYEPVERDTLYRRVIRDPAHWAAGWTIAD
ncbi:MAG TPA: aminofutalosine synthase MqnE [Phycisphaerae bacterium]|jgi:aminodeoxyfutalosine synthase|nr:aminofutalosine synthase MqnE [Phycisphaerae bacterium]